MTKYNSGLLLIIYKHNNICILLCNRLLYLINYQLLEYCLIVGFDDIQIGGILEYGIIIVVVAFILFMVMFCIREREWSIRMVMNNMGGLLIIICIIVGVNILSFIIKCRSVKWY